jgi:hypothetical protein
MRTLTLLAARLAPGVALACTCMWVGPFTKVALGTDSAWAVGRITTPTYGQTLESAPLADVLGWVRSGGVTRLAPPEGRS